MASITVQYKDGRETFSDGIQSAEVVKLARESRKEDGVSVVLICDGDPELLSSWGEVTEAGNYVQPDMRDMRQYGLGDDLIDDLDADEE